MIWSAAYKCRLCGEIFCDMSSEGISSSEWAADSAIRKMVGIDDEGGAIETKRRTRHVCADGSYGIADFVGIKKINRSYSVF